MSDRVIGLSYRVVRLCDGEFAIACMTPEPRFIGLGNTAEEARELLTRDSKRIANRRDVAVVATSDWFGCDPPQSEARR